MRAPASLEPVPSTSRRQASPVMSRKRSFLLSLLFVAGFIAISGLLISRGEGRAVQAPRISLDMVIAGNGYDESTNAMTVGTIDNCLAADGPANNAQHNHTVHLVIENVEDLTGWQARLNYIGDKLRPSTVNYTPFTDNGRGQAVSFLNLPIDQAASIHFSVIGAEFIPVAPADGSNTPQTALMGASYQGTRTFAVSPDTPAKDPPDDASYSAPSGGILASLLLQVVGDESGQVLLIDLDDANPNKPGSKAIIFDGTGARETDLAESALGDGVHAEGVGCVPPPGPSSGTPPATGEPGQSPVSPGATNVGTAVPGGTTPSGTSPTPVDQNLGAERTNGGDGTSLWIYVLVAAAALASLATFIGWRFRSRLPWLRR